MSGPTQRDLLGRRGEAAFETMILRPVPGRRILFSPAFLGDKWPGVDFLVDLVGASLPCPFYVQVRATQQPPGPRGRRLPIYLRAEEVAALARYPAPTYVVGIHLDEAEETGYILSANGEAEGGLAGIPTHHPLTPANLLVLWDEVSAFWSRQSLPKLRSAFAAPEEG